jgi:exopolysaccharide biosynthesis polyprenyl glycosylphosphotransferase
MGLIALDKSVPTLRVSTRRGSRGRRGYIVTRALVGADILGIVTAFYVATAFYSSGRGDTIGPSVETILFLASLPVWLLLFKLHGLYDRDGERADHATADDLFGVVQVVTLGVWFVEILSLATGLASPEIARLALFWVLAISFVTVGRAGARGFCRRQQSYIQRAVVVGEGDIGQLVARKIRQHPEYGLELLGFVDGDPKSKRTDIAGVETLGSLDRLGSIVAEMDVDRVIVAFSREPDGATMEVIRGLRDDEVTVDVVPRLFELVGLRSSMHMLEGLALICIPPARLSRSSLLIKRLIDVVIASVTLVIFSPFFLYSAYRIKRDSPGPVLFRQIRLGAHREPFTAYKFRTMKVGTDPEAHREYIRSIMDASAAVGGNGFYKLDQCDAVTPFGRWLRKTSLDELPQLLNVLRGDMSIVGPRPCIPYETENFEPYHEDRFLVPQGITGLWQVAARANATYGEALNMDVAYVHGWSMGLDLRLIFRTPFALLRQRRSTA